MAARSRQSCRSHCNGPDFKLLVLGLLSLARAQYACSFGFIDAGLIRASYPDSEIQFASITDFSRSTAYLSSIPLPQVSRNRLKLYAYLSVYTHLDTPQQGIKRRLPMPDP